MKSNYKRLGDFIEFYSVRAIELVENLDIESIRGISSISKSFIKTRANLVGVVADKYKVVTKDCFAYNPNTARMGDKIPIALNITKDIILVSSIYPTFRIEKTDKLDPEYLMMWFRRPEFDRYARYKSHGSAREVFDIDEMNELILPIPSIEKQQEIVREYKIIQNRIALNNQLITKLEETAQTIYKQWFVDFEFPDENRKPYKSYGGEMVWCEELGKALPKSWIPTKLGNMADVKTGPFGSALLNEQYILGGTPVITVEHIKKFEISDLNYPSVGKFDAKRLHAYSLKEGDIIFSRVGSVDLSAMVRRANEGWLFSSRMLRLRPDINKVHPIILSYYLRLPETRKLIISLSVGSTMPSINTQILKSIPFYSYPIYLGDNLVNIISPLDNQISIYHLENQKLSELKDLLLAKMTKVECKIGTY